MSEHFEALEADFAREYPGEYNGDLRVALWGESPIGARRLYALVKGMSTRSAIARSFNDGQEWNNSDELLAVLAELVDTTNRILYQANAKKGSRVWEPLKIGRPGEAARARAKAQAKPQEVARFFKSSDQGRVVIQAASSSDGAA